MTKNETIVDRVVARLKAQPLGDLITEEDLHDIVKDAIPRAFFETRRVTENPGSYHSREITKEPLIVEILRDLVKPVVVEAVRQWLVEHAEDTQAHWRKVLDAGIVQYVQAIQGDQATALVRDAMSNWVQAVNNERQKAGLPMLGVF